MTKITNNTNNQIGGSLSGVTEQFLVANDSNTASSTAISLKRVGGGSSGDPFHQYTVTGATTFSKGIDNSDSDAYVIAASTALGTTNCVRIASTGEVNFPKQSAFLGTGATRSDVTGNGNTYNIGSSATAFTSIYDQNSDFNTNGTYTAPVTGIAEVSGCIPLTGLLSTHTDSQILIASSNRNLKPLQGNPFKMANPATSMGWPFWGNVDVDAGDTIIISIEVFNGTLVVDLNLSTFYDGGILY